MTIDDRDLGVALLCDVCDNEILLPDDLADAGCCTACGIAYLFDRRDERERVSA